MLRERSYKTVIKRPRCVACARPMRLVRKTLRFAGLPDLHLFECEASARSTSRKRRRQTRGTND